MVSLPEEYPWSSYLDYIGARKAPQWLTTSFILGYFGTGEKSLGTYRKFTEELLGSAYKK